MKQAPTGGTSKGKVLKSKAPATKKRKVVIVSDSD